MEKKYIIVGAGGLGREIACSLEILMAEKGGTLLGFLDDSSDALGELSGRYPPILASPINFEYSSDVTLLLGVADPISKMRLVAKIETRGGTFGTFIHPTAMVVRTARLGRGCVLCRDSGVSADATLGNFVLLNGYSGAGHDAVVGDGATISSFVDVCGKANVGREVFIGSHASILPGVRIGDRARVGAGSIVMRNVRAGGTVYQPAARALNADAGQ